MCVSVGEPVRIVLESDGTQVEDGEYFQTLTENTIFIILRPGEVWAPAGEDIVSQGEFIPSATLTFKIYNFVFQLCQLSRK